MGQYGKIGRIYLTPEDQTKYANRVKSGGCKKISFTEGWVEFLDKKEAKSIAADLNSKPIGGKKRHNFYRDDIWCMRYLSRFTWSDLIEHRVYQKQVNQKQLQAMISKQKKEDEFYLKSVAKKKRIDSIEKRKVKKGISKKPSTSEQESSDLPNQKVPFRTREKPQQNTTVSILDALAM